MTIFVCYNTNDDETSDINPDGASDRRFAAGAGQAAEQPYGVHDAGGRVGVWV